MEYGELYAFEGGDVADGLAFALLQTCSYVLFLFCPSPFLNLRQTTFVRAREGKGTNVEDGE
ncbi:hypothetical protein SCHPADRAFT_201354 [Schizopora paradoxa]|uniref:Uncharacterized protein n=1 Tax=Schizopora paradoxa TaxID=27342 RepID=A0A0H2S4N7_9AGAM|nr:hypothetical protein SCHPADRAFT_201354 [Schizopora paradoxa]